MKKKIVLIFLLFTCLVFTACSGNETTALTAKKNFFYLSLGGSVNVENYFVQEGKGKLYYSVENPEVLELDGNRLRGKAVGRGAFSVESDGLSIRIEVEVVDDKKVTASFPDQTYEYDGKSHLPLPEGDLPEGSEVVFYWQGELFTGAVDAGEYLLETKITVPAPYHIDRATGQTVMTIAPKRLDLSGVRFSPATYTYDGTEKKVEISGTLPEGVTVTYQDNVAVDAGIYNAVAYFHAPNEKNYLPVAPESTQLVIQKKYVNLATLGFSSATAVYDGASHPFGAMTGLPEGTAVDYYLSKNGTRTPLDAGETFVDSGEYNIYAALTLTESVENNYAFVSGGQTMSFTKNGDKYLSDADAYARLYIKKSPFYSDHQWRLTRGDEIVMSAPYGKEVSVGGEGEYSLRLVGTSHGVNGEFSDGASVVYSTLTRNQYGNLSSGSHVVTASFIMPEGSEKNYTPLPSVTYVLSIDKGRFDMSAVRFAATTETVVFDPEKKYDDFAVDGSASPDFSDNFSIKYSYKINGQKMGEWLRQGEIASAGEYEISASFTVVCADKDNYLAPADMTMKFKILPVEIPVDIDMAPITVTYDGLPHKMEVTGTLPEGMTALYSCGDIKNVGSIAYTDAGTYEVKAEFAYRGWARVNYVLKKGDKEIERLIAVLTIEKADPEPDVTLFTQKNVPTYSSDLLVSDIELDNNDEGFVTYKNGGEKVKLIGSDPTSREGWFFLALSYNPDRKNYNDYDFSVKAFVKQKAVDLSQVTVPTQFVAFTGEKVSPKIDYGVGVDAGSLTVTVTSDSDMTAVGKHLCSATLAVTDAHAYYAVGDATRSGIIVYIYNSALYSYAEGTTSLVSYKGSETDVVVPDGTTGIRAGAFGTAVYTYSVYLPDSVTTVVAGAFAGANTLEEISFPTYFNVSAAFDRSVPIGFSSVIVRNDTVIADRAFSKLYAVKKIAYLADVTTVGEYAFEDCSCLEEISFPSVPVYAENALYGCRSLKSLRVRDFPSANYYFGSGAKTTYTLETIEITQGTVIADNAFKGLTSPKTVVLPSSIASIGKRAFDGLNATVDLSATAVTALGELSFASFGGEVVLPAGLTSIAENCFNGCSSSSLLLPKNLSFIGVNAFSGCTAEVIFATDSVMEEIGERAFKKYSGKSLTLPASVSALGVSAFEESCVESFDIPEGVTIGAYCFRNSEVRTLTAGCKVIPEGAFYGCASLSSLTLSNTETIGTSAFYGCGLNEVELPATLTAIGESAFASCPLSVVVFTRESDQNTVPAAVRGVFPTNRAIRFYVPELYRTEYSDYIRQTGCDMEKCTIN